MHVNLPKRTCHIVTFEGGGAFMLSVQFIFDLTGFCAVKLKRVCLPLFCSMFCDKMLLCQTPSHITSLWGYQGQL